ncbi:MAG: hypothetical protein F4Z06_06730 [Acidimicrobiia bacterium]|nr:hypothetical protein [Acidimicrobiia bacterium]MYE73581.1 hypothetical protein [Acidimicrobiia bacterium]MYJ62328.1 hypothetical protein [Acidimicrobiia bacterium]
MVASNQQLCTFAAIDFETATAKRSSACALGLVIVDSGRIVDEQSWLIRPPGNEYHSFNTRLHGISASDTEDAASFGQVWSEASAIAQGRLLVAHNAAFDISVLRHSATHHDYTPPEASYLCTYRLARSRWPDRYSWKLPDVCEALGIDDLDHHDPLSDARAAARVLLAMCEQDECEIEDLCRGLGYRPGLISAVRYPPSSNAADRGSMFEPATHSIDSDGLLFGKRVAFTGTLVSMTREDAFQVTVNSGGEPSASVSRRTDYLVVGMTDFAKVGTDGMSSKMRKAVELAGSGATIEIIDEGDFLRLAAGEAVNPLGGNVEAADNDDGPRLALLANSDTVAAGEQERSSHPSQFGVPKGLPRLNPTEQLLAHAMGIEVVMALEIALGRVMSHEEAVALAVDVTADLITALAEFLAEDVKSWAEGADDAVQAATEVVEDNVADMKAPADTLVGDIVADAIALALADTGAKNAATEIATDAFAAMSEAMEAATAKEGREIVSEIVNSLSQWQPPRSQQSWILGSVELRSPP